MAKNTALRVGGISLNPAKINKPFLESMLKATKMAELSGGKERATEAIQELYEKGQLSEQSLDGLSDYAKTLRKEWKADKNAIWEAKSGPESEFDPDKVKGYENDLTLNAPFLGHHQTFTDELREATALSAVQAIAGADFGPTATVAGYAAYLNGTTWNGSAEKNTRELVGTYKDYLSGTSHMTTEGNSVRQVHRAELWKTLTSMTREAAASGKEGKPVDITAQYYELTNPELVGNLADAAKSGGKLRLNLDAGRLDYPAKDPATDEQYYEVDDLAAKMRTAKQFMALVGADVGVSFFPSKSLLGSATDLMHRKVLRVGEEVLMSGMNGNVDSGENVDAGYVVEGPAAKRFADNAHRDIQNSSGAGPEEIWGEKQLEKFDASDLRMGTHGLVALFDAVSGPTPAGTPLPHPKTTDELEGLAKKAGLDLKSVLNVEEGQFESTLHSVLHEDGVVSLSDHGKKELMGLMKSTVKATQKKANLEALADVTAPSGKKVGDTTIDIGDLPSEREVLAINAINSAEEFVYMPGFVVTRAVAAAVVARQEQAQTDGKPLDIRVVADPGIYPFGGTPNSWGVNYLEDHDIPVRWAKLERSGKHDRKVHAKQLLTDKGEIAGSTNFSKKGMRENWETSAYVRFEKDDEGGQTLKEQSKAQFEDLWDNHTYELSTADLAKYYSKNKPEFGHDHFVNTAKAGATREIITAIENYEVESGSLVERLLQKPEVSSQRDQFIADGYSDGDSALMAVKTVAGQEFQAQAEQLPTSIELERLKSQVERWKTRD